MAKRFLSLDDVVADAMTILPGANSEDFLIGKQWAYTALRDIGVTTDYINVVTLYPDNLALRKPDDYHSAIDLALYAGSSEVPFIFREGKKRIHQKTTIAANVVEVSESADFFHLSSNATTVTHALLRYFTLPVDHNGNPIIPEDYRLAIMLFIRYLWAVRRNEPDWPNHQVSWERARNALRGNNKVPNGLQFKQFAKEWISLIHKTHISRF